MAAPGQDGGPARASRLRKIDRPLTYQALFVVLLVGGWELFARTVDAILIPTSVEVFAGLVGVMGQARLWEALWASNQALIGGYLLALVVGIPMGFAMGRSALMERALDVWVSILLVTPLAGLMPLIVMALGIGLSARIVIVFIFAIVMVVVSARAGIRGIDRSQIEMARSFGASEYEIWRNVLIPGALPAIMTGARIALGRAITGMVVVELLLVAVGVGALILTFRGTFQPGHLYATVVIVVIQALLMMRGLAYVEKRVTPWLRHD
jgi:ABC-type nitrate/sulfonate/bicarbonate transport system permease component